MLDVLGYAASCAVLATFLSRTMVPLRLIAIVSNVLFLLYGYFDHILPVMLLHMALLPINAWKLVVKRPGLNVTSHTLPPAYAPVLASGPYAFWFVLGLLSGLMGPLAVIVMAITQHA